MVISPSLRGLPVEREKNQTGRALRQSRRSRSLRSIAIDGHQTVRFSPVAGILRFSGYFRDTSKNRMRPGASPSANARGASATRRVTRWRPTSRARAGAGRRLARTAETRAFRRAGPVPEARDGAFRGKRDVRRASRRAVRAKKPTVREKAHEKRGVRAPLAPRMSVPSRVRYVDGRRLPSREGQRVVLHVARALHRGMAAELARGVLVVEPPRDVSGPVRIAALRGEKAALRGSIGASRFPVRAPQHLR